MVFLAELAALCVCKCVTHTLLGVGGGGGGGGEGKQVAQKRLKSAWTEYEFSAV